MLTTHANQMDHPWNKQQRMIRWKA